MDKTEEDSNGSKLWAFEKPVSLTVFQYIFIIQTNSEGNKIILFMFKSRDQFCF